MRNLFRRESLLKPLLKPLLKSLPERFLGRDLNRADLDFKLLGALEAETYTLFGLGKIPPVIFAKYGKIKLRARL